MRIIDHETKISDLPKQTVLTIGNFDGVHRGHQSILSTARQIGRERNLPVTVMTFEPHPAAVLHPERAPGVLTPLAMKQMLLASMSIDYLVVIRDSLKLLNLSPEAFVDQFLMEHISPSVVVEGPDFNFGYGRSGDIQTLQQLGEQRGFEVVEVPFTLLQLDENLDRRSVKCSSSEIRQMIEHAKIRHASQMLGRPYRLTGKTIPGRGVGQQLGFPTANIEPAGQVIPCEGVYAGYVVVGDCFEDVAFGGLRRAAAISIGRVKTFETDHPLLLEAHILENKVENLRGKWLGLDFMRFLRHQQRFETKEALKQQIARDVERAELMLF